MRIKVTCLAIILLANHINVGQAERDKAGIYKLKKGINTIYVKDSNDKSSVRGLEVDVFIPSKSKVFRGDILVLPGYKHSRTLWQKKTDLIKLCGKYRFRAVFPEMGRSVYATKYYPETKKKWHPTPGAIWIRDKLLPELRKYGLFLDNGSNYLLGLSTGGRGVAMVSLTNKGLFDAGAALSGDFNQSRMPKDPLMTNVYGQYQQFKKRWDNVDNPQTMADYWEMPVYLGHGVNDPYVPFSQTRDFYMVLREKHPKLDIVLHAAANHGHDWKYWRSEMAAVLRFFRKHQDFWLKYSDGILD